MTRRKTIAVVGSVFAAALIFMGTASYIGLHQAAADSAKTSTSDISAYALMVQIGNQLPVDRVDYEPF